MSFNLTVSEALYLKRRVLENHRQSLFAFMLDRDYVEADADSPGDTPRRSTRRLNCVGKLN